MRMVLLGIGLACAIITPAHAQDDTTDIFVEKAQGAMLDITMDAEGQLSGPGFERLLDDATDAQFFLIGEQHAARDIALAQASLQRALAADGYDYFVVEIGPWAAAHAEAAIRSSPGGLRDYIQTPGQQFVLPFLYFEEEAALVEQAVSLSPKEEHVLWGVDQIFVGSGPVVLNALRPLARTQEQRAAVDAFARGVSSNFMYVGAAPDPAIEALLAAFGEDTGEGRKLTEALALTHRIYGPFIRGTGTAYEANLARENYMKANFLEHFRAAEARDGTPPKAVFRFGANHMARGRSSTDVPSLGDFATEWGRSRDFRVVNVMFDCLGGEIYAIQPGGPAPCESEVLQPGSPLRRAIGDARTALLDLRALRPSVARMKDLDPATRDLVFAYDYYLTIRDVTPQTPLADLTLPGS